MNRFFITILVTAFICAGVLLTHAGNSGNNALTAKPLPLQVPQGWPQPVYNFKQNPLTQQGFELGRKLFYDGRLSKDGNFSCASCHQQFAAFATFDHDLSHGFNNSFSKRNAPALFNMAWQKSFMFDGGINHLDLQALAPLTDAHEMAENIDSVLIKLRADASYKKMFKAAFGDDIINTQRFTKAISQFILQLVSSNSKYDKVIRGEATFTLSENSGYTMFKAKCASCHTEPLFTDFSYRNTGLPLNNFLKDYGRMVITNDAKDSLKFKVPSLRNVMVTAPYGHDGRFSSVRKMMDHYSNNVIAGPTTDSIVKNKIPLSNYEIGQLVSFLYTLTDSSFIKDPRFSQP